MVKPWTRLEEEIVYEGARSLARRRYRRGDGGEAAFDITLQGPGAIVLALTGDQRVVLTRQFRPGPERVLWDLPSGFIDDGEDPAEAAARELAEETGYAGDIRKVGELFPEGYSTEVRHVFVATGCTRARTQDTDADEEIEVELVSVEDLRSKLRAGEVTVTDAAYVGLDALGLL